MELLSIELSENSEIFNNINIITNIDESDVNIEIFPIKEGNIRVRYLTDKEAKVGSYLEKIISQVTKLLIEYTKSESRKYLEENYFYFDEDEFEEIKRTIEEEIANDIKIQLIIKNKFKEVIENSGLINLNGFIKFRLKFISLYAAQIVEKSIDNYLMKKEYFDFINIIRYITEAEEKDYDLVNVIYNNSRLQVYDSSMKKLTYIGTMETSRELDGKTGGYDEAVINTLLSLSPTKIKLHMGRESIDNEEALNTVEVIRQIFSDKLELCNGCKYCQLI